jgi:hypothetical protein
MNYIVFDQTNFIFSHQLYSSTYHCNCYHIFMLPVAPTLIGRECWKTFHLNYVSHFWHIHWVFVRIARKVITQFSGRNFLSSILSAWFLKWQLRRTIHSDWNTLYSNQIKILCNGLRTVYFSLMRQHSSYF